MIHATRLRANPTLKHCHPPLELGVEQVLLPSQLIYVDEENDGPAAFAGWAVKASNLEEKEEAHHEISSQEQNACKKTYLVHVIAKVKWEWLRLL
jgi:hypothetical protein